jgi:hypothetical protein
LEEDVKPSWMWERVCMLLRMLTCSAVADAEQSTSSAAAAAGVGVGVGVGGCLMTSSGWYTTGVKQDSSSE